jgi:hypothetical protein
VDAEKTANGFTVKTVNVRTLALSLPDGASNELAVKVDDQAVSARPWLMPNGLFQVYLMRKGGRWRSVMPQRVSVERTQRPYKMSRLTGPIDDAFTEAFVCVRGSEKPWHDATNKYVEADLLRFKREWAQYFRGELVIKEDIDVTNDDIANRNLILFGDPASNSLIAQVLDGLPLTWTREQIGIAGKTFPAAGHVPVLIYPNPLNPQRYVVLNSGHTFHESELKGTNALLYPRLGDFAILRLGPASRDPLAVDFAMAGLFDEYWQPLQK